NFVQAVSGIDLLVGARGGEVELMLYAIFHLGGTQQTMRYESYKEISQWDEVAYCIPLSLGDTHEGYPVVATENSLFTHYQFHRDQHLHFSEGSEPQDPFDVVLGCDVAKTLAYALGKTIRLTHGASERGHAGAHDGKEDHPHIHTTPFTVHGILAPTGTPLDRSILITLSAMEKIHHHEGEEESAITEQGTAHSESPQRGDTHHEHHDLHGHHEHHDHHVLHSHGDHSASDLTAVLIGLKHRGAVFRVRQKLQSFQDEALSAVIPGVVMDTIWRMLANIEIILLLISSLVTITGLAGLAAVILAGLSERRRELAILRSVGARPYDILILLLSEGTLLVGGGILGGLIVVYLLCIVVSPIIANTYGIFLDITMPSVNEWLIIAGIFLAGVVTSLVPALRAYRISLTDGLNVTR
ncbi:MAG: ABC transporter permease, partial [Desulfovibrio sp.]|nr:ABC transporter permease [Desulfovibrio sp.]